MSEFQPRPNQRQVLAYTGGWMGISAVPGSGKTRTLAELAAQLVATRIAEDQEVLIVTLVNSAVDNFKNRINASIKLRGLLPGFGYRVRTLHGLAHDIVRERPGLVGLSEDFGIIDEREAEAVLDDAVNVWLQSHPDAADIYLSPDVQGSHADWVKRTRWPAIVRDLAGSFIKRAKDLQLTPAVLQTQLDSRPPANEEPRGDEERVGWEVLVGGGGQAGGGSYLARMATGIYADYQRGLGYRGVVDFDDLIRLALEALCLDPDYLARLRSRWPYILEDEAQDSSRLQEEILRRLAGEKGNWVRVGDPNQAIFETFTTSDPQHLRRFVDDKQAVLALELPESGRSQPAIIALANFLIDWVRTRHPLAEVRDALREPHIRPTDPGDPQPNPPAAPAAVQIVEHDFTPEQELQAVVDSVARWVAEQGKLEPDDQHSCAVLAPRNQRGFELIDLLKSRKLPYVELLRSTSITRQTAGALGNVLRCLADPAAARKLAVAFKVWRRDDADHADAGPTIRAAVERIARCPAVEAYLWPRADRDWLAGLAAEIPGEEFALLTGFREVARTWHRAAILPIDQLILTLASDLFRQPAELALAHKLAGLLRDVAESHPTYRLSELVEELGVIARNERRFLGFASEDSGFEPPRGTVTVATMHKAKGLEWDRVYLMSVNNYDFPSGQANDTYIAERWFVRDRLNLQAEALSQLESLSALVTGRLSCEPTAAHVSRHLVEGEATRQARVDYIAERLRLLYVGITRARRELIITWNKGRQQAVKLQPAVPLLALQSLWQESPKEQEQ